MERTVTVTGSGRVIATPDVADVRLGVVVTRPTVADARQRAAEIAARILASITGHGIDRADIQTSSLTVQPEYEYGDGQPKLKGQQVSHQYGVTVRDLAKLGPVIDDGLAAGATTLDGVTFRVKDREAADAEARRQAMRDARSRAELLCGEAGVRLGAVVSIAEAGSAPPPRPMAMYRMAAADMAQTPVEAGSAEVVASVVVTWEVEKA